jgi:hypothetical protein
VLEEEFERLHPKATKRPATARSWAWTFDVANEKALAEEILDLRRLAIKLRDRSNPIAGIVMERSVPARDQTDKAKAEAAEQTAKIKARTRSRMLERIATTDALYQAWIDAAPAIISAQPPPDPEKPPQDDTLFEEIEKSILATRTALLGMDAGRQGPPPSSDPETSANAESPEASQKRLRATLDQLLDEVVELLDRHRQRATYGAVGAVVDRLPRYLMRGRPRDHRHSWIVNAETGLPTNYGPDDMHPELLSRPEVLKTSQQLEDWLRDARVTSNP